MSIKFEYEHTGVGMPIKKRKNGEDIIIGSTKRAKEDSRIDAIVKMSEKAKRLISAKDWSALELFILEYEDALPTLAPKMRRKINIARDEDQRRKR